MNINQLPDQYAQIAGLLQPYGAYLVGGAVRDLLLDKPVHDLDFALPEGTVPAARQLADNLDGAFYLLDDERETTRVILSGDQGPRLLVDFTVFQGETIEEDLAARDFTITSMALEVGADGGVIDPFQGRSDLREGLIRATSEGSLANDPVRCLRAVRLAAQLEFQILPDTIALIRQDQSGLANISPERLRDELFRILEGPHQAAAILALQSLGMYDYLLPGGYCEWKGNALRHLTLIWSLFLEPHDQDRAGDWFRGLLVHRLGRFREQVQEYLAEELVSGRSIYQLSLLMTLLNSEEGEGKSEPIKDLVRKLTLSNQEGDFLEKGVMASSAFSTLSQGEDWPNPLDVYRFYRRFASAGVAGVSLGLAREYGSQGQNQESWITQLESARNLFGGYWEHYSEWVDPPLCLDGNDIQRELKLKPGPRIGVLLEALREGQVESGFDSPEDALDFLRGYLSELDGPGS